MIQDIDAELTRWLEPLLRPATLSLAAPSPEPEGRGASVYLLRMAAVPSSRGPHRAPNQIRLHYLVTAWGESPEDAHSLLGTMLFATLDRDGLDVAFPTLDASDWLALGVRPQPSFVLCAPLLRARPEDVAKPVRRPLEVRSLDLRHLHGLVLGNDGVPVAGARVTVRRYGRSADTDDSGRFVLAGVPTDTAPDDFAVLARGRHPKTTVDLPAAPDDPFVLHVDLLER
jgi:hypothetical protein